MWATAILLCDGLLAGRAPSRPGPLRPGRATPVHMGGGTLQPRPSAPFDPADADAAAVESLPAGCALPELIVFDLDNTLWTPELYTLRHLSGYASAGPPNPVAGEDVWLLDGAAAALNELATHERWQGTKVAVASRTNKGPWARALLREFGVPGVPQRRLAELMPLQQIFPADKQQHLRALREASGVPFERMLFFDDALGGRYGNCEPVSRLGVLSAHCPRGLTTDVWRGALEAFAQRAAAGQPMGVVLRAGAAPTAAPATQRRADAGGEQEGVVSSWLHAKGFGFVEDAAGRRVFFHRSVATPGWDPRKGAAVRFRVGSDARGRAECLSVTPRLAGGGTGGGGAGGAEGDCVTMPCFSMNMPFAGLVAHGYKTIESRNGTMFLRWEGRQLLLHVGRRTYPDGGKHREIMRTHGATDEELARLTALPPPFARGHAVAPVRWLVTLGGTELVEPTAARCTPAIERACVATGAAMGRYLTTVERVEWLRAPVAVRGQPGVFDVSVPRAALPEGERGTPAPSADGGVVVFDKEY